MVAGNKFQSNPYILGFWYLYIFYLKMLFIDAIMYLIY